MTRVKSLFESKTFQGATLTLVSSLGAIVISCAYDRRPLNKEESITALGLVITFCWVLVGRIQNTPVYTPDYLPGANKSDFELKDIPPAMKPEEMVAIGSLVFTILTNSIGAFFWLSQRRKTDIETKKTQIAQEKLKASEDVRREVNKERDFNHLKNNQQQMSQLMVDILEEVRETQQDVSEIKTILLSPHPRKETG